MRSAAVRWFIAVAFVLMMAVPLYLDALSSVDLLEKDAPVLTTVVVGSALAGFVVARWWALLLPFVPVLLVLPLGVDAQNADQRTYADFLLWVMVFLGLPCVLAGVVLRILLDRFVTGLRQLRS